jgi:starvation-inducible DNA-binding protein
MEELINQMKITLADVYAFYIKAQNFHWNVEGPNFVQYHEFFGKLYEEVGGSIDPMAEEIRALGAYTPASLSRFMDLTSIADQRSIPTSRAMIEELQSDNNIVLSSLMKAYKLAEQYNEIGLSNFLQDRSNVHKKHAWMLKSLLVTGK